MLAGLIISASAKARAVNLAGVDSALTPWCWGRRKLFLRQRPDPNLPSLINEALQGFGHVRIAPVPFSPNLEAPQLQQKNRPWAVIQHLQYT